ncbi:hypothetical protein Krac_0475 [Ktedonobacter racemifer DSM 44963]|uniref:Uncharacterized protein n=1 Tax=Ktedonobacter racemifer DSM 44963 TaxID=485913 RepID=D6U7T5_KTERA|nr:hypothetical protein Krac_0475 [Ktedonobacter racemifer DSM 44963]
MNTEAGVRVSFWGDADAASAAGLPRPDMAGAGFELAL